MRSSGASRAPGALLLATAIAAPAFLRAQAPQPSVPSFRADIEHVQVDVRVVDANNEPVAGLTRDLFQVFEDGVLQDIDSFAAIDLPRALPRQEVADVPSVRADAASNIRESADSPIGIAYRRSRSPSRARASRALKSSSLLWRSMSTGRRRHGTVENSNGARRQRPACGSSSRASAGCRA